MDHECKVTFNQHKIDDCSEIVFDRCFGKDEMILELHYQDQDGQEFYFDNWRILKVNYCPFCGLKSQPERLSEKAPQGDATV